MDNKLERKEEKSPLDLKLHERMWVSSISKDILRVPFGWIYSDYDTNKDKLLQGVFVPDKR